MKRIALGIALSLTACAGMQQHTDDMMEQVRAYNDSVRWDRYTTAAVAVPPRERDRFIEDHEDMEKELHIGDYDVVRVSGGAKKGTAKVEIKWTWYKDDEGVVHETRALQSWERHGKAWLIIDEWRVKGPEMPGLREPDKKKDKPGSDDAAKPADHSDPAAAGAGSDDDDTATTAPEAAAIP